MPARPYALPPWGQRTVVMGVVNVTPDSFSGDGLATAGRSEGEIVQAAVAQGRAMVEAGAEVLDVGAESSRPAAVYGAHPPVDEATELRLAVPVVEALVAALGERAMVSIDTTKGAVARSAVAAGAGMVNDVWAGHRDPGTVDAAAATGAYLVVMHNKDVAEYPDGVLPEVVTWLRDAAESAAAHGVASDRLLVDPGIGFGKTPDHSLEVLHRLAELKAALGLPLLVGTSRKRFIGEILGGAPPDQRLEGSIASAVLAVSAGADVVRVHDVDPVARAVRVADAIVRRPAPPDETERSRPGRIAISGITAEGRHGVGDEERAHPQPFEVDVTVDADLAASSTSDRLDETVDYAEIRRLVTDRVAGPSVHLLETLAAEIGQAVLARWPAIDRVEVAVRKPRAARSLAAASIEVRIALRREP